MIALFSFIFNFFEENITKGIFVKAIASITMIVTVFFMFFYSVKEHNPQDPLPEFEIIDAARQKEFGALTVKSDVGMFIKNFSTFDLYRTGTFVVDFALWFKFASDQAMLETINNFSFENGNIIKKSPADIKIEGDKIVAKYDVRMSFKTNLDHRKFPLSDHRITLVLTNNFVTPREMFFNTTDSSFQVNNNIFIPNWSVKDTSVESGYLDIPLEHGRTVSAPKVRFTVNLVKKGAKKAVVIFFPLFLAIFLALYSFMFSTIMVKERFVLASSSVPALLGYRFVLENLLPKVAYFTVTDKIYTMLLGIAFSIFVFQALFVRYANQYVISTKEKHSIISRRVLEDVDTVVFISIICVIILGTAFCIFF